MVISITITDPAGLPWRPHVQRAYAAAKLAFQQTTFVVLTKNENTLTCRKIWVNIAQGLRVQTQNAATTLADPPTTFALLRRTYSQVHARVHRVQMTNVASTLATPTTTFVAVPKS